MTTSKKTICVLLALILMVLTIIGIVSVCKSSSKAPTRMTGICESCRQESVLHKYVKQGLLGNKSERGQIEYLCGTCLNLAKVFGD